MLKTTKVLPRMMAAALCTVFATQAVLPAYAQDPAAVVEPADAQTTAIVDAANAFLALLTDEQRAAVLFDFTDATQRANWSNLPRGLYERAGVPWGELDEGQRQALTALLGTVLSPYGLSMVQQEMAADDVLAGQTATGALLDDTPVAEIASSAADNAAGGAAAGAPPAGGTPPAGGPGGAPPGGGGPGGGASQMFGSDNYYVSFLGEPSATEPWMLQFGGHHLAINATIVGADVTFAPSLTGGQPTQYLLDGEPIYIVEREVDHAAALLATLTDDQRTEVVRGDAAIQLVLGPGADGLTLQPEGLPASAMTAEQKDLLLALIEARIGILNDDDRAAAMADIEAGIDDTYLALFGTVDDPGNSYWRITGPRVVLEFSPQGNGDHLHNMYRDPANDYGAAWTAPD